MLRKRNPKDSFGDGKCVVIAVRDSGCAISPEYQEKIFDPFFTTKGFGTGLALNISRGIIEDHGGAIEVRSEPGQGSVFTVTLPVIDGQ